MSPATNQIGITDSTQWKGTKKLKLQIRGGGGEGLVEFI